MKIPERIANGKATGKQFDAWYYAELRRLGDRSTRVSQVAQRLDKELQSLRTFAVNWHGGPGF